MYHDLVGIDQHALHGHAFHLTPITVLHVQLPGDGLGCVDIGDSSLQHLNLPL